MVPFVSGYITELDPHDWDRLKLDLLQVRIHCRFPMCNFAWPSPTIGYLDLKYDVGTIAVLPKGRATDWRPRQKRHGVGVTHQAQRNSGGGFCQIIEQAQRLDVFGVLAAGAIGEVTEDWPKRAAVALRGLCVLHERRIAIWSSGLSRTSSPALSLVFLSPAKSPNG